MHFKLYNNYSKSQPYILRYKLKKIIHLIAAREVSSAYTFSVSCKFNSLWNDRTRWTCNCL